MNQINIFEIVRENGPIVATAIHDGHILRKEVADLSALADGERLREEDPFTREWTSVGNTQIIGNISRFEVDLNRPREKAIYMAPEDAWGLEVHKNKPSQEFLIRSLSEYDTFYAMVHQIFTELEQQFGRFVVFDLHSYNYLRKGPTNPPADPEQNPEVNIGTGSMNKKYWAPLIDRFISDLRSYNYFSRNLDVRENVKFKGGHFSKWIHQTFPDSACSISIEFKKFFMDEWTGIPDTKQLQEIRKAIQSTIPGVLEELNNLGSK